MESSQKNKVSTQQPARKRYIKPKIEQVRLVLEEAVLGSGCKTVGGLDGPAGGTPCDINGCQFNGT